MKYLSIYKTTETGAMPTPEEMARMGKLVEDGMKAGFLCELRQLFEAPQAAPAQTK